MDKVLRSNAPPRIYNNDVGASFDYSDYSNPLPSYYDQNDARAACHSDIQHLDQNLQFPSSPAINVKTPGLSDDKAEVEQGPWPTAHYPTVEVRELYPPHTTYKWPRPHALFCKRLKNFRHDPCEWKAPKYKSYREKQKNNGQKDKHNPWTEDTEIAFQKALRLCGGRGRHKQPLAGKPSGCNEWMSWVIWAETGKCLGRKKVSSHLQVLKGKMECVPEWLDIARPALEQNKRTKGRHSRHIAHRRQEHLSTNRSLGLPPTGSLRSPPSAPGFPRVHSITYEMKLKDNVMDSQGHLLDSARTHHVYTELQSERPSDSHPFEDVELWRSMFPSLELLDSSGDTVPTYRFDAGISLQEEYIQSTVVQVRLDIKILNNQGFDRWLTKTQLYDEEGGHKSSMDEVEAVDKNCFVTLRNVAGSAQYWAKTLKNLLGIEKAAQFYGGQEQILLAERQARECLDHIHFCKQLWAVPRGAREHKLVANLLWKFYLVGNNIVPTTTWRELVHVRTSNGFSDNVMEVESSSWPSSLVRGELAFDQLRDLAIQTHIDTNNVEDFLLEDSHRYPPAEKQLMTAESSPATEQTADVGSSILSSASLSFPPSLSSASSMTQQSQQSSFESLEFNDSARSYAAYPGLRPGMSNDLKHNPQEASKALIAHLGPNTYDYPNDLQISQEQLHDVLGQIPSFPSYDTGYANLAVPSNDSTLIDTTLRIPAGFPVDTYRQDNCNNQVAGAAYVKDDGPPAVLDQSPLVAPKAQAAASGQNHILQLQNFDFLQQDVMGEGAGVPSSMQTANPYSAPACRSTNDQPRGGAGISSDLHPQVAILPSQRLERIDCATPAEDDDFSNQPTDYDAVDQPQQCRTRSSLDQSAFDSRTPAQTELRLPTSGRLSAYVSPFSVPPPRMGNLDRELQEDWHHLEEETYLNQGEEFA